jgi:hypothetical protein
MPAATWVQTNWPASSSFFRLYARQGAVVARTWDAINGGSAFLTNDSGAEWSQIGSADSGTDILSIVMLNGDLLAGTYNGLYSSTSSGTSWNAVTPTGIPADTAIWSLATIDATLFAGAKGGIYRSSDGGGTWTVVSSGIPADATITSIIAGGNDIFAGSDGSGVLVTSDGGTSWTAANTGLADTHVSQLAAMGTRLFAVTLNGVFVSDDQGTSWAADSSGLRNVNCLFVVNTQLLAGTDASDVEGAADDGGVYLSVDNGASWDSFSAGLPDKTRVWSLAATSDSIFAGTDSGVWRIGCSG